LDRGLKPKSQVSSNLCADCHSLSRQTVVSAFARIPLFCLFCQPFCFHPHIEPLIIVDSGCNSKGVQHRTIGNTGVPEIAAAQILKDQPAKRPTSARANFGSRSARRIVSFGSCNGIVLCGIPYRGSGALASPVPTNRPLFPCGLAT